MGINKIKITPVELAEVVKLEINPKFFKYVAKKSLLKFNLGFLGSFCWKASKHLKIKESNNDMQENHPLCSLWIKLEKAMDYNLEFTGVSIYYMRFIYESRKSITPTSFEKSARSQRTTNDTRQRSTNNKSYDYETRRKSEQDYRTTRQVPGNLSKFPETALKRSVG